MQEGRLLGLQPPLRRERVHEGRPLPGQNSNNRNQPNNGAHVDVEELRNVLGAAAAQVEERRNNAAAAAAAEILFQARLRMPPALAGGQRFPRGNGNFNRRGPIPEPEHLQARRMRMRVPRLRRVFPSFQGGVVSDDEEDGGDDEDEEEHEYLPTEPVVARNRVQHIL